MSTQRILASMLALLVTSVAGCALDASSNTHGTHCVDDTACTGTQMCHRGFCVDREGIDGAISPDSGRDAMVPGVDTGVDAGVDGGSDSGADTGPPGPDAGMDVGIDGGSDGGDPCEAGMGTCLTGEPGVCSSGHRACVASGATCLRNMEPSRELCSPEDEDCDGRVDEESDARCYPTSSLGCTAHPADGTFTCTGVCQPGIQACNTTTHSLGACTMAITPGVETCQGATATGFDEDCNGTIDPLCGCSPTAVRPCFGGAVAQAGVGECHTGTQTCDAGGHWGSCTGDVHPMPETCMNQGHDDDCDGFLDNIPGAGVSCPVVGIGECGNGTMQCMGSTLMCRQPTPVTNEVCDHRDDDCDGATDESFNFAGDPLNCGDCGIVCGAGTSCCNGVCVDEASDDMHCGACLNDCTTMTTTGAVDCCDNICLDTDNDEMNCGACGNVCSGGQLCCGGSCIDPLANAMNCNTCGHACSGATSACCGGVCHAPGDGACTGCSVNCGSLTPTQTCCSNSCADRMTDENNCGTCGHHCNPGDVCCGGSCVASDTTHCGGSCTACVGELCCNDTCVPVDTRHCHGCGPSAVCATGASCCATGCFDLHTDATHCGDCLTACTGTQRCTNSHCCATNLTYCGSSCTNTLTDNNNCGSCGNRCTGLNGCNNGHCQLLGL